MQRKCLPIPEYLDARLAKIMRDHRRELFRLAGRASRKQDVSDDLADMAKAGVVEINEAIAEYVTELSARLLEYREAFYARGAREAELTKLLDLKQAEIDSSDAVKH